MDHSGAKGKARRSAKAVSEPETAPPPQGPPLPQFQFKQFAVLRVLFQEVANPPAPRPLQQVDGPSQYAMELSLGAKVLMRSDGDAEVRLGLTVTPDPLVKPYDIQVEVFGLFGAVTGSQEQLAEFCRTVGPPILFPYVRQIIETTSANGRFGTVRLDPLNVQSLLQQRAWATEPPLPNDKP